MTEGLHSSVYRHGPRRGEADLFELLDRDESAGGKPEGRNRLVLTSCSREAGARPPNVLVVLWVQRLKQAVEHTREFGPSLDHDFKLPHRHFAVSIPRR